MKCFYLNKAQQKTFALQQKLDYDWVRREWLEYMRAHCLAITWGQTASYCQVIARQQA